MMSYTTKLQWLLVIVVVGALPGSARAGAPVGQFNLQFLPSHGIWDVSGDYPNNEFDVTNDIDLVQDEKGKITGIGTGTGIEQGIRLNLVYNFTGSIKTVSSVTRVLLTMKISGTATDGSITLPVRGTIKLKLDLDIANNLLIGSGAGNVCVRGRCVRVDEPVQFDIPQSPQPMDGNWALALDLQSPDNKKIVGTGTATLSNGRVIPFTASGNYIATKLLTKLKLKGTGGTATLTNNEASGLGWLLEKAKIHGQTVDP